MTIRKKDLRLDLRVICGMVKDGSSVIDLGCGRGELLAFLVENKNVRGTGIEISEEAIYSCVEKGLSVAHQDIDTGLKEYPDGSFDYVIFNQTMQQVARPKEAIREALRIGRKVIVGFPNFCSLRARFQIFFLGRVPVTPALPYQWYDTPNLHFLSIKDFERFCKNEGIKIEKKVFMTENRIIAFLPNLFAGIAVFQISKK